MSFLVTNTLCLQSCLGLLIRLFPLFLRLLLRFLSLDLSGEVGDSDFVDYSIRWETRFPIALLGSSNDLWCDLVSLLNLPREGMRKREGVRV